MVTIVDNSLIEYMNAILFANGQVRKEVIESYKKGILFSRVGGKNKEIDHANVTVKSITMSENSAEYEFILYVSVANSIVLEGSYIYAIDVKLMAPAIRVLENFEDFINNEFIWRFRLALRGVERPHKIAEILYNRAEP